VAVKAGNAERAGTRPGIYGILQAVFGLMEAAERTSVRMWNQYVEL